MPLDRRTVRRTPFGQNFAFVSYVQTQTRPNMNKAVQTHTVVSLGAGWSAREKREPCYMTSIYFMYLLIHFMLRTH